MASFTIIITGHLLLGSRTPSQAYFLWAGVDAQLRTAGETVSERSKLLVKLVELLESSFYPATGYRERIRFRQWNTGAIVP
jgi:hypothetical protein|uniref:Uncharacterized protein n=1 Tax=Picea glauca TaxID=3330 RepID=A0A101LV60_PICGL|nr:hypothetical protein ABT39_MTgene2042 [Picea glauca]QHR89632.1 hypothetical protein Q903MT_gene3654 [Picea sitchensis]